VGWSRVLFKVHNITGSFPGHVSLRKRQQRQLERVLGERI